APEPAPEPEFKPPSTDGHLRDRAGGLLGKTGIGQAILDLAEKGQRGPEGGLLAGTGLREGILDLARKGQEVTPKTLTADEGALGEHGALSQGIDLMERLPLRGGAVDPAIGRGALRTVRGALQSADTAVGGEEKLRRGDLTGAADIGMGTIGALAPQFSFVGNVAAEKAKAEGFSPETAEALGAVAGFLTPAGGVEREA